MTEAKELGDRQSGYVGNAGEKTQALQACMTGYLA